MRPIRVFEPLLRTEECLDAIRGPLESGWLGSGPLVAQLEAQWVEQLGVSHAIFVNSCSAALHTALAVLARAHGWGPGDEVVSSALTFVATNEAILHAGLRPVFADVDQYLCLDPEALLTAIGPRTRAVVFMGMGGSSGQLPRVAQICRERGLALVLDAAHMAGTTVDGRQPALYADVSCYSFHAVKNLPTQDSGMVCFADPDLDARARRFVWLGIARNTYDRCTSPGYEWDYTVSESGFKYQGNDIAAAIAMVGLKYLQQDNEQRRWLARQYASLLAGCEVEFVPQPDGCLSAQHLLQVRVGNRLEVLARLHQDGIYPGVHYRDNTEHPLFAQYGPSGPRTRSASAELLSLPLHLHLGAPDLGRVSAALRGVARRPGATRAPAEVPRARMTDPVARR